MIKILHFDVLICVKHRIGESKRIYDRYCHGSEVLVIVYKVFSATVTDLSDRRSSGCLYFNACCFFVVVSYATDCAAQPGSS